MYESKGSREVIQCRERERRTADAVCAAKLLPSVSEIAKRAGDKWDALCAARFPSLLPHERE